MYTQCWQVKQLRSRLWCDDGIAVALVDGEFCPEIAAPMLKHAAENYAGWGTIAAVADYSGARLRLTEKQMLESVVAASAHGTLSMPAALVVRADDLALFRSYAKLSAQYGHVRGVFLCRDAALSWVRTQAGLYRPAAQRASRQTPATAR